MNGTAIRRWHRYIGFLTAPTLVFFCLTGAVQLFSLHEAHGGYHPYEWVEKLSSVHKDQVLEPHHAHQHGGQQPPAALKPAPESSDHDTDHGGDHEHEHEDSESFGTLALKVFLLLVALGLTTSATLGVWIGLTQLRQKRLGWVLLAVGAGLPLVLLALG